MPACGALRFLRPSRACNPPSALALDPKPKARRYAPSRHRRPLTLRARRKTHLGVGSSAADVFALARLWTRPLEIAVL